MRTKLRGVTYSPGVLRAGGEGNRPLWATHASLLRQGIRPVVPGALFADAALAKRRVHFNDFCAGIEIEPTSRERVEAATSLGEPVAHSQLEHRLLIELALRRSLAIVTDHPRAVIELAALLKVEIATWGL